jgi:hypothetical protein
MQLPFTSRRRHPFFPKLAAAPAARAKGGHAALYGSFHELIAARCAGACARRAVFVTIREGDPPLSEENRDALWEMYQTPSFVLLVDRRGRLLAYECETQTGLHVNDCGGSIWEWLRGRDADEKPVVCECGRPGRKVSWSGGPIEVRSTTERYS